MSRAMSSAATRSPKRLVTPARRTSPSRPVPTWRAYPPSLGRASRGRRKGCRAFAPLCIVELVKTFTSSSGASGGPAPTPADRIARPMPPPGRSDWSGFGTGWAATGTLLAGILTWGGIGWVIDRLADTGRLFLAIGLVVGAAGGIYLVYLRYGRDDD